MPKPLNLNVPAQAEAAAEVRAVLRRWLAGSMSDRELGDTELVVTELLGNSVRHAAIADGDPLYVRASAGRGVLHVEVEDGGSIGHVGRRPPDPETGGLGLNLVEALAIGWGVRRDASTTVWAELPFRQAG
jgi:anti-sigma regulatory factor (Ser/Thr protein kinase)